MGDGSIEFVDVQGNKASLTLARLLAKIDSVD
jgi:hypothetical protein